MLQNPSVLLRVSYCLVVLGATVPFGLAASGWVGLAKGPGLVGALPFLLGPPLLLLLGAFRIYLVARYKTTLSSPQLLGIGVVFRALGLFALHVGALSTLLSWVARPLMRAFLTTRTESGAEFFAVGVFLLYGVGAGSFGLLLFEFSRLLGFERLAHERSARGGA